MKPINKEIRIIIFALLIIGVVFLLPGQKTVPKPVSAPAPVVASQTIVSSPKVNLPLINLMPVPVAEKSLRVPVLMYHHVGYLAGTEQGIKYDQTAIDLTVSPQDFEAQVGYFKNLGFHTVTLAQVYDALENGAALPAKPIVFTFDDGYKDVFVNAVPILQKYDFVGTFAIATELLGRPSYAVWDDVTGAQKLGMEIVSHTENHLDLTNPIYSDADLHREIIDSKILLEQKLGVPIDFFVYPYGHHNAKVEQMVKDAGYKLALTTAFGLDSKVGDLWAEPRVRVHGQNGLEKLKKIFSPAPRILSVPLNP